MSQSADDRLRSQVFELAESCLQATATAKQVAQLDHLLSEHPSARRDYLAFIQDSYSLRIWALSQLEQQDEALSSSDPNSAERLGSGTELSPGPTSPSSKHRPRLGNGRSSLLRRSLALAAGLAAMVVFAIGLLSVRDRADLSPSGRTVVATLIDDKNCRWSDGASWEVGARLRESQGVRLNAGVARIRFQDGATVTLEGPSELEFLSAGSARLRSGILTTYVPPRAVGFQLRTEALDVVDLGTSFGVVVTETGETSVSVFSGSVQVSVPEFADQTARIVKHGDSVRGKPNQETIESLDSTATDFRETQKAATGIESTSGSCLFLSERAVGGLLPEDDTQILVALEQRDLNLQKRLVLNFVPNPDGEGMVTGKKAPLAAGQRVDCFLVQFRPHPDQIPQRGASSSGRVTFDRPILGIISKAAALARTDRIFAGGKTKIEQALRGGEGGGNSREKDTLVISDDRRTIEISARVAKHLDQVRVIVGSVDQQLNQAMGLEDDTPAMVEN